MRIISGLYKSRHINFPKTRLTRPVTDRAKETIFNILGTLVEGTFVLDLFAGSGSLGIESLSRGAKEVTFVDHAGIACQCIRKNLALLDSQIPSNILQLEILDAIEKLEKKGKSYDLIFLDPPHNKGFIKKILQRLDRSDIVKSLGLIVIGHSNKESLPESLETLHTQRVVKIGQGFVSFVGKTDKNEKT
jgi:16S rRNA (guanine(966)-N(2))-methyltransferase RsmD